MADIARAQAALGCYTRGSRTVILRRPHNGEAGSALVRTRADALKRLAHEVQSFWLQRGR